MDIKKILQEAEAQFNDASNFNELNNIKSNYLGKDGVIAGILNSLKTASIEEKKTFGKEANMTKGTIAKMYQLRIVEIQKLETQKKLESERIDISLPGSDVSIGNRHPLTIVAEEITSFFEMQGYSIVSGNEVATQKFNFDQLNIPADHPARSASDTFYVEGSDKVLRTHCTNVTAQKLSQFKEEDQELKVVSVGAVYRNDEDDATHSHQFMQIDGFHVSEHMSFANLKWILLNMAKHLFGDKTNIRLRPSFFPFTEPSVEVDVSCARCNGIGCNVCSESGWIEVLGAGMINPVVMKNAGIDSDKYTGLAFGIGVERIAMLKYGVDDIRRFYTNDVRFISQWGGK